MNDLAHEKMRFRTLSVTQLYTRLGRIEKVDKLQRYIQVAEEFGYMQLVAAGKRKLDMMLGRTPGDLTLAQLRQDTGNVFPPPAERNLSATKSNLSATKPKPKVISQQLLKRSLEF